MSIEREIFRRKTFSPEKLIAYGFEEKDGVYSYSSDFYDGFYATVRVFSDGSVDGKVFDREFSEEYNVFRLEGAQGSFLASVKSAYISFLSDISEKTTNIRYYDSDQANRISDLFFERFGAKPEFMWEKFPHFGVYRNEETRKWFAIIMNIAAKKLSSRSGALEIDGEIEIVNLFLGEKTSLYIEKGALPSYHMSKKNWVSVPLNDSISDSMIEEMANLSFAHTKKS